MSRSVQHNNRPGTAADPVNGKVPNSVTSRVNVKDMDELYLDPEFP
jgi:hypothetical protein